MNRAGNIHLFKNNFEEILSSVNTDELPVERYCRRYLVHLLEHKRYYIGVYAGLLQKLLAQTEKDRSEIRFIDYGAGNGLLGLFAKFCGFKEVFINDIDPNFINAAKQLSVQLNITADGYLTGDVDAVKNLMQQKKIDAVAGTDVIEHIYDLSHFFKTIREINPFMITVFTTASNPENFMKVRSIKRLQIKDELQGGIPGDSTGENFLKPFLKIREDIIRKNVPGLAEDFIVKAAKITRGKNKEDIITAATQYVLTGTLPDPPQHPTNTCNPLSGSWTERILSLKEYTELYASAGFKVKFYPGFYNDAEGSFIKKMMNAAVAVFGNTLAPYILIAGYPLNRQII